MQKPRPRHRTIVYVDGFNFYYGAARGTPWKWLDPVVLFGKVLGPQDLAPTQEARGFRETHPNLDASGQPAPGPYPRHDNSQAPDVVTALFSHTGSGRTLQGSIDPHVLQLSALRGPRVARRDRPGDV